MNIRQFDVESPEEVFSTKGGIKVLSAIVEYGELNISQLARHVGMNHSSIVRHIKRLENAGLVNNKRYETIKIIGFKPDDMTFTLRRGYAPEIELKERTE